MTLRLLIILAAVLAAAQAQTSRTVRTGVYTEAQAARGKAVYAERCAGCHGASLSGGDEAPGLVGEKFLAKWQSRSVGDLFETVRRTMPADKPGSLSREVNADIVAHILAVNRYPAGTGELSTESAVLRQIGFRPGGTVGPAADPNSAAVPVRVEGKPIDALPPEKSDNKPNFPEQTRAPYHATAPYKVTTLIDKMPAPWSLTFLPQGKILLTHRLPGSLRILDATGVVSEPITGVDGLKLPQGKGIGLLDVVLDPKFESNQRIFFSYFDYVDGTDSNTNIARARLDVARGALSEVKLIFRATPAMPSRRLGAKTGGRIVIAPDGTLFMSTGDRSDSPPWDVSQKLDSHLGKILHITAEGAPAADNPFLGKPGVLPEIWAYGVRNPEGLAYDPQTGKLWENEHGPRGGDEINIIEKGRNYGWPIVTHGIDYPGNAIGEDVMHKDGMEDPIYYWDPVIAPSGLAFYTGSLFPQWKGSLFVGGLRLRTLNRLSIVKDKVVAEEPLLAELGARIRDVRVGPDGAVYVLTDSGTASMSPDTPLNSKLLKLTPK